MRSIRKQAGLLIVVELGAAWPEGLGSRPDAVRRVVAQNEGETPEAFAARLGAIAGRLFAARVELRSAIVACNERTDLAATVARRAIASGLLERLGPSGTFAFAASPRSGGRLRHALSALASDLLPRASADITVEFGTERDASNERSVARVA